MAHRPFTPHQFSNTTVLIAFCLTLSVGFITPSMVNKLLMDITQMYPPRVAKDLMKFSEKVHWNALTSFPMADDEELDGKKWLDMYNAAKSFKYSHGSLNDLRMPLSLCEWVEVKKHLVLLNYRNSDAVVNVSGISIMLPYAREQKLREIGIHK